MYCNGEDNVGSRPAYPLYRRVHDASSWSEPQNGPNRQAGLAQSDIDKVE